MSPGYQLATHGYVVVVQDVRGRYTSEGEWYPFRHEIADGYDTVEWVAALPYSNGKVGMMGGSYVGATQMLAAIAHPPHLAGICPVVTASNYHDGWTYQGGAFEQWFDQNWTTQLAHQHAVAPDRKKHQRARRRPDAPAHELSRVQLRRTSRRRRDHRAIAPYYLDWLAHPDYDAYWKQWSIEEHFADIQVPALHIGGWYDIFLTGTLRNYMGIKAHGGSDAARNGQRLLIQIGGHAGFGRKIGDVEFGDEALEIPSTTTVFSTGTTFSSKGVQNEFGSRAPRRQTRPRLRDGRKQISSRNPTGHRRKRRPRAISCTPQARRIRCGATALSRRPRRKRNLPDKFTYDPSKSRPHHRRLTLLRRRALRARSARPARRGKSRRRPGVFHQAA